MQTWLLPAAMFQQVFGTVSIFSEDGLVTYKKAVISWQFVSLSVGC